MAENFGTKSGSTTSEIEARARLVQMLRTSPLPDHELAFNLGLYQNRILLSRQLFMHQLYQMILEVHGVVMEFGIRWGQNMALFQAFRGMYEPYNHSRTIVGFDTFEGFPAVHSKDGGDTNAGDYAVTKDYELYLDELLSIHETMSPLPHKKKYRLVKGDAGKTVHTYLEQNPHTVVALAYFDMDIYEPTKACLEAIIPRLTKGSVLGFDELNCPEFPGETLAVMETLGLSRYALRRSPLNPLCSYAVVE